jgi:hypothetical protein
MNPDAIRTLTEQAERATRDYLRRVAVSHLDCAVGAALQSHSVAEVKAMLRKHADHLEEFG